MDGRTAQLDPGRSGTRRHPQEVAARRVRRSASTSTTAVCPNTSLIRWFAGRLDRHGRRCVRRWRTTGRHVLVPRQQPPVGQGLLLLRDHRAERIHRRGQRSSEGAADQPRKDHVPLESDSADGGISGHRHHREVQRPDLPDPLGDPGLQRRRPARGCRRRAGARSSTPRSSTGRPNCSVPTRSPPPDPSSTTRRMSVTHWRHRRGRSTTGHRASARSSTRPRTNGSATP